MKPTMSLLRSRTCPPALTQCSQQAWLRPSVSPIAEDSREDKSRESPCKIITVELPCSDVRADAPLTPRSHERRKADFQRTGAEIDNMLSSITGRWIGRAGTERKNEERRSLERRTRNESEERKNAERDNSAKRAERDNSARRSGKLSGLLRGFEELHVNESVHAGLAQKVPLTRSRDGEIHVDIKALQRGSSSILRGVGDQRPLTKEDIDRATQILQERQGKMHRATSAPNFVDKNCSSLSLKCLRPEVQEQQRVKQARTLRARSAAALSRRSAEVELLRSNAFRAARTACSKSAPAKPDGAPVFLMKKPTVVKAPQKIWNTGTVYSREVMQRDTLGFKWVAVESFLNSIQRLLQIRKRQRTDELWDQAVKFARVLRFLKRLRRKKQAYKRLRIMLRQFPPTFRWLIRHRKRKFAATRIQRLWRWFTSYLDAYVKKLVNGAWQTHEKALLDAIFSECQIDDEVIAGSPDMLTLTSRGVPSNEASDSSTTVSPVKRSRSPAQAGRTPSKEATPESTGGGSRNRSRDSWAAVRSSIVVPAQEAKSSGIVSVVMNLRNKRHSISAAKAAQDERYYQILEEAIKRRVQQRVGEHCFRKDIASTIIRREIVERLYEYRRHEVDSKRRCLTTTLRMWMDCPIIPGEIRLTSAAIGEIVLCAHYGHGARPSKPEAAQMFFHSCPCWKVDAISGILAGTRTIREGVNERWAARRGHLTETLQTIYNKSKNRRPSNVSKLNSSGTPSTPIDGSRRNGFATTPKSSGKHQQRVRPASAPTTHPHNRATREQCMIKDDESVRPKGAAPACFEDCFADARNASVPSQNWGFVTKPDEDFTDALFIAGTGIRTALPQTLTISEPADLSRPHSAMSSVDAATVPKSTQQVVDSSAARRNSQGVPHGGIGNERGRESVVQRTTIAWRA